MGASEPRKTVGDAADVAARQSERTLRKRTIRTGDRGGQIELPASGPKPSALTRLSYALLVTQYRRLPSSRG